MTYQQSNCAFEDYYEEGGDTSESCEEAVYYDVVEDDGEANYQDELGDEANACVFGLQLPKTNCEEEEYFSDESFEDPPTSVVKLPSREECCYTCCYCEENIWRLCDYVRENQAEVLSYCYAVFISNKKRVFPLWEQRSGHGEDHVIFWDYHVFFLFYNGKRSTVFDLDSTLPFPSDFRMYTKRAIRSNRNIIPEYQRRVRVIPAEIYLETFASDRSHMLNSEGQWIKDPPKYAPISTPECCNNLDDFISMDAKVGYGQVLSIQAFFKSYQPERHRSKNKDSCNS